MKRDLGNVELFKPKAEIDELGLITPASLNYLQGLSLNFAGLGRFSSVIITDVVPLSVGGNEGGKFSCKVTSKKGSRIVLDCIIKSYLYHETDGEERYFRKTDNFGNILAKVNNIATSYNFFRIKGFPVPPIVRVFTDVESNTVFLLLSDLTQGGKFRIWGFSNKMTISQKRELMEMNLTQTEINAVVLEATKQADDLAELGISLVHWYFHILQDKKTRKLSICFLDLDELNKMHHVEPSRFEINNLKKNNQLEVNIFRNKLLQELKKKDGLYTKN